MLLVVPVFIEFYSFLVKIIDFHEQIMVKMIDFPIPEAGKSQNIDDFDLT